MDISKTAAPNRSTPADTPGTPDTGYRPSDHERERQRYRRSRKRRHTWISTLCTLLALVVVGAAVVASPGWERVDRLFFDGAELRSAFPDLLRGFWLNIQMFLVAEVLILVLGLLIALVRVTRAPGLQPLRLAATVYVDVFRGVPTLLLIFLVGFGLPRCNCRAPPPSPGSSA
ncbi:ABC transporter permease subunit [Streptomyces hydrogenans]|uniref:ABC transporter permease subunit n=1 Tax=Streptomyces hydrogenans TaxID=1873719 RepID=UPI0035D6AB6E